MIGTTLSHFKITAKLGAGGMGEVYRAEDTKLGREVAIKVLPEAVAGDPERLARFEREAKVLASLNHLNIAAIYSLETAETADTSAAERGESDPSTIKLLVMELVEGEDLRHRIARGPIPVEEALPIAAQIAAALEAAHFKSIIHRDLKPGNVMVTPEGKVKVLDFGLARRQHSQLELGEDAPTATMEELTQQGQIVGTVPYMSPEQIRSQRLDSRSDIFSLGVMLFEMLTSRRPFGGDTSVDVIAAILRNPAPDLQSLRPEIPQGLKELIEDCMAKHPSMRPESAGVVGERIAGIAAAGSTARRSSADAAGASNTDAGKQLDPRVIAVLPFDNLSGADEAEFLATGLHNDLVTELSRVAGLTIISRTSVMRYRQTDKTVREIGRELNAGTLIEGTVQCVGNRVRLTAKLIDAIEDIQRWAERYDRELSTETLFDLQSEVTRKIVDSLQSKLAPALEIPGGKLETQDMETYRLCTLGRVQVERRTESGCRRAIEHFQTAIERDPEHTPAWAGLGVALAISVWYGYSEPGDLLTRAQRAALRAVELDPDSAEAHCSLATCFGAVRNGPQAMEELELAVQLQPSYWEAHNLLSYLHHLHGRARESLAAAKQAVAVNPLSAEAVNHLSLALLISGEPQGGLKEARHATELSPGWSTATFYEALSLYELGRYGEAVARLTDLKVEWAGLGVQATLALTHLAASDEASARGVLDSMDPKVDAFAVGLVHLALGETEVAFQSFHEAEELADWACLAIHHLYRNTWIAVENDPRYEILIRRAYESHQLEPHERSHHA